MHLCDLYTHEVFVFNDLSIQPTSVEIIFKAFQFSFKIIFQGSQEVHCEDEGATLLDCLTA